MAIYRLLQNSALGPEEISRLAAAYEQTLRTLDVKHRNDPITQLIAKKIIGIGQTDGRDPAEISRIAVEQLLARHRVLIIEDDALLAMDLEIALRSFGAEIVARVGDLDEAHDRVAKGDFDVAVVDINLRGRDTFSVADVLRKKQIPFVFATGYGKEMIPARFADVTLWEKPFSELKVARDVARLCPHAQAGIS